MTGWLTILLLIAIIYRAWQIGLEVGDPGTSGDDCAADQPDFCGALR